MNRRAPYSRIERLPKSRPAGNVISEKTEAVRQDRKNRTSSSSPLFCTITWIFIVLCTSVIAFYIGVWTVIQVRTDPGADTSERKTTADLPGDSELERKAEALAQHKIEVQLEKLCKQYQTSNAQDATLHLHRKTKVGSGFFSKSISHFARGLVRVAKDDLMQSFDFGVPPTLASDTQDLDSLILYNKNEAIPTDENLAKAARYEDPTKPLPILSARKATENCDTMNVVLMNNPGNTRQCFALVGGQYQSYHIQRWMRRPDASGALDPKMPLKLTSRGWAANGKQAFIPPKERHVKNHEKLLTTYLSESEDMKFKLKEVLVKMDQKTIVVLTCNFGQSELLMNFVCSARARGFDLRNVLVFPTDLETNELAEGMGITTFYEEKIMASIPKKEANVYGDRVFTAVMFAKVLCVQLVNELGYDLLFQDADVVWYKNPLEYFHDKLLPKFDVYFQDDGSRSERYAPYSANSGFYFVRSNDKTRHLLRQFLYSSYLIDAWNSHQQVLIALLSEHSSVMGLSVKIFPKQMEEFPGGLQFHRKKESMKKIVKGDSKAIIFHMSWTKNKEDKLKFFQQMGEWYLNDQCIGKEAHAIAGEKTQVAGAKVDGDLTKYCCSIEPLIKCHYRDKPSKIPCPDSPLITENERGKSFVFDALKGESFW